MRIIKRWQYLEDQVSQPQHSMAAYQAALQRVIEPLMQRIAVLEDSPRKRPGLIYRTTDIAYELNLTPQGLHREATEIGLLVPHRVGSKLMWKITEEGSQFVRYGPGGTRRIVWGESMGNSLWWSFDTVKHVQNYIGPRQPFRVVVSPNGDKEIKAAKSFKKLCLQADSVRH